MDDDFLWLTLVRLARALIIVVVVGGDFLSSSFGLTNFLRFSTWEKRCAVQYCPIQNWYRAINISSETSKYTNVSTLQVWSVLQVLLFINQTKFAAKRLWKCRNNNSKWQTCASIRFCLFSILDYLIAKLNGLFIISVERNMDFHSHGRNLWK